MTTKPQGVFQDENGKWTWHDPETGTDGEPVDSREEARASYLEHMRAAVGSAEAPPAEASAAEAPATKSRTTTKSKEPKARKVPVSTTKKQTVTKKPVKKSTASRKRSNGRDLENGPVARAKAIFKKMGKRAQRKDVLDACEADGINRLTAATYYQRWKSGAIK